MNARVVAGLAVVLLAPAGGLAQVRPVTDAMLRSPDLGDWLMMTPRISTEPESTASCTPCGTGTWTWSTSHW